MHEHTVFVLQKGTYVLIWKENDMKFQTVQIEKSSYDDHRETMKISFWDKDPVTNNGQVLKISSYEN